MADSNKKPLCRYGAKCYRKNADHLNQFSHPWKDSSDNGEETEEAPKAAAEKRRTSDDKKAEKSSEIDQFAESDEDEKPKDSSPKLKKARTAPSSTSENASASSSSKKPTKKETAAKETTEDDEENSKKKAEAKENLATTPFEGGNYCISSGNIIPVSQAVGLLPHLHMVMYSRLMWRPTQQVYTTHAKGIGTKSGRSQFLNRDVG